MIGQPAPQAIFDLLACNCAKNCELPQCTCMTNGLKCTETRVTDCSIRVSQSPLLRPPLDTPLDNEDVMNEQQDKLKTFKNEQLLFL